MASIPEQLAAAPVTDTLTGSPSEVTWPQLGWANERGTFEAEGWKPPSYNEWAPTHSYGGALYKATALSGGNAFAYLTIPVTYSMLTGASYRSFSVWLFASSGKVAQGYQLRLKQASAGTGTPHLYVFMLLKFVNGEGTLLAESEPMTIETGGAFALAALGGVLTMWRREGEKTGWARVGEEVKDSAFTAGYSAIDGSGSNPHLSNFGTGVLLSEGIRLGTGVRLPSPYEPSTRLAISLLDEDDSIIKRWGPDEADAADVPRGLAFSTSDPGGFKDCSLALSRRIDQDFSDLRLLRPVRIHGAGRRVAWEGRLQEIPRHEGEDFSINPTAIGHIGDLDFDPSFKEIYVGRDLGEFTDISAQYRLGWGLSFSYAGFSVAPDSAEGRPSILLEINGHWEEQIPIAACMLDPGTGLGIAIVDYEWAVNDTNVGWILEGWHADDDKPTNWASLGDLATGGASGSGTLTPSKRLFGWQWHFATGKAGGDGNQYRATLRRLVWFGKHGLPIQGEAPNRGLFIADVIADIVSRCAPGLNFTTGEDGSIESSSYVCPHLTFPDPIKGSDAILGANAYHQRSWGVEEGKRFFWRSTGTYRKRWKIRRSRGHGVELLGPQAEAAINGVVVNYTDPSGVTRVVAPLGCTTADYTTAQLEDTDPTNPVNEAGIERKWAELSLSFVTDDYGAVQVGYAWLQEKLRSASSRGSVTVCGLVEDETGTLYPAWYMRAGDSATVEDGDRVERRIIETNYDHDSRTVTCNLDATPHKVEALMERMGVALVGVAE